MNLFAIVENENEQIVYRIPLSQTIQEQLKNIFTQQTIAFFWNKEIIPFDGSYNTNTNEIFTIPSYGLKSEIIDSITNPLNYNILDIENLDGKIKAIYSTLDINNVQYINFQYFDTRNIIANKGFNIFLSGHTYRTFDKKGISITDKLTAVFKDDSLFFFFIF